MSRSRSKKNQKKQIYSLADTAESAGDAPMEESTAPKEALGKEDAADSVTGIPDNEDTEATKAPSQRESISAPSSSNHGLGVRTNQDPHEGRGAAKAFSDSSTDSLEECFHVFTWLNAPESTPGSVQKTESNKGVPALKTDSANIRDADSVFLSNSERNPKQDLEKMNQALSQETVHEELTAYRGCLQRSRRDIVDMLAKQSEELTGPEKMYGPHGKKVGIVNAAESIFELFLPLGYEGPTVQKFWGGLYRLMVVSADNFLNITFEFLTNAKLSPLRRSWKQPGDSSSESDEDQGLSLRHGSFDIRLTDVLDSLEMIARRIQPFRELLSTAKHGDLFKLEVPAEMPRAWLHLVMYLVMCTEEGLRSPSWHAAMCDELLAEGMRKIVRSLSHHSLLDNLVLAPAELALLINFQLLQDVTKIFPDISESYGEYLRALVRHRKNNQINLMTY